MTSIKSWESRRSASKSAKSIRLNECPSIHIHLFLEMTHCLAMSFVIPDFPTPDGPNKRLPPGIFKKSSTFFTS